MNDILKISCFFALMGLISCKNPNNSPKIGESNTTATMIQVQGHRGQRGHSPENSIPAFLAAIDKGVDVVEMDVVVSKDGKIVVSHEPFMSSAYVLTPEGKPIVKEEEKNYNLYEMDYNSIRRFDIGSKGNESFPEQERFKTYKPLFSETIDRIENHVQAKGLKPVRYNVEIKSVTEEYGRFQPEPKVFVNAVMKVLKDKDIVSITNIQSFDTAILEVMHEQYPNVQLAYLVGSGAFEENMAKISFKPEIYSPHFSLLDQQTVKAIQEKDMLVIPWTVNEQKDIDRVKALQVDGIITDYPERAIEK